MVFVNETYDMVVNTQFHKFYGRSFARVLYLILMKDILRSRSVTSVEKESGF